MCSNRRDTDFDVDEILIAVAADAHLALFKNMSSELGLRLHTIAYLFMASLFKI